MKYYLWTFDTRVDRSWFLGEPRDSNGNVMSPWLFKGCKSIDLGNRRLFVPVNQNGEVASVAFGAFDIIYVMQRWGEKIREFTRNAIELIPVTVEGDEHEFAILNVLNEVECVDETLSEFSKWDLESIRPDLAGQYKFFTKMVIDPNKAEGHHIFRPWGYHTAVIVSEELKKTILELGGTNTIFLPV